MINKCAIFRIPVAEWHHAKKRQYEVLFFLHGADGGTRKGRLKFDITRKILYNNKHSLFTTVPQ